MNPCISMHGVMWSRVQYHRAQVQPGTDSSSSDPERLIERPVTQEVARGPPAAPSRGSKCHSAQHLKPHKQFRRAISLRSGLRTTSRPTTSQGLVAHKPPAQANCSTELLAHKPAAQATATSRTSPVAHKPRLGRTRKFFSVQHSIIFILTCFIVFLIITRLTVRPITTHLSVPRVRTK